MGFFTKNLKSIAAQLMLVSCVTGATFNSAQAEVSAEQKFQDLFTTAGYATAFGAALGAAMLSFTSNPQNELRYVAVGASIGFISGSLLGTYMIFSPMLLARHETPPESASTALTNLAYGQNQNSPVFAISPVIDTKSYQITAFSGAVTFARF